MSIGTVTFTPRGADSWADPWGEYAALRAHDPVHHVVPADHPDRDYYVLSRHADILAAAGTQKPVGITLEADVALGASYEHHTAEHATYEEWAAAYSTYEEASLHVPEEGTAP